MAKEYELTPADYLSIMRRRAPYLIGTFVAVLLAALIVVIFIPRTYQATGTIMVESQDVPESVVPTQLQQSVDERINGIKQRVLTRESLLRIANKYNVFSGSASYLSSEELVQRMRDRVDVELVSIDTVQGFRTGKATVAFNLSFQDKSPQTAFNVANDLVGLFLNWNTKLQTENATETSIFLANAAATQKQEVERLNGLVSDYKQQHGNALPELANLHMSMLLNDETELSNVEQKYNMLQAQLAGASSDSPDSNSLPVLKAQLTRLSSIYSDEYPDIQALKLKIAALEKARSSSSGVATKGEKTNQQTNGSDNDTLESLARQQKKLQDRIAQNKAAIMQAPGVAQGLDMLTSESEQKRYQDILGKLQDAQMAENLKKENKADRFVLLEPPIIPDKPFKPIPGKMMVMGFFLALASSGGMLMAMVALDNQIRGADALEHVLGNRPLAVIPYLVLKEEEDQRKRKIKITIIVAILAMILIALAIQFFYMPLTDLFIKIMARLVV